MLPLSDNLFLIQSSLAGEGKTKGMAKGLILCHENDILAGESAGFGLPVLKTDNQTIFPSLFSSKWHSPGIIEAVYDLNLIHTWRILGVAAPFIFTACMEKLAGFYMRRPGFQQTGLKIRNATFAFLQIHGTMKPCQSFGYCRILYQANDRRLTINVNGQSLLNRGQLILLNEVPGTGFSRMITRFKSDCESRDGNKFLPWQVCTIETAIENPGIPLGFYLSFPENVFPPCVQIAAGREVGRDLNWAGLSLATGQAVFTYHVNFYTQKVQERQSSCLKKSFDFV